jgi:GT2 family glycosyltransferase
VRLATLVGAPAAVFAALLCVPIAAGVWLVTSLADAVGTLLMWCLPRPRNRPTLPRDTAAASIMILNWNGRPLLERLLPSVREAVARHGGKHEVIVVDNGSTDDSIAWTARHFPEVKLVCHPQNEKFVRGYNLALDAATRDIVLLLNNDMVVDHDFLGPLLDGLRDADVFATSARITVEGGHDASVETGLTRGRWSFGLLKLRHEQPPQPRYPTPCLWAGGGSSAIDRRAFAAMGGFDDLYAPFYVEDVGASYDAWRRGYRVLWCPDAHVLHARSATVRTGVPPFRVARIKRRNELLFAWRSVTSPVLTAAHCLLLPVNLVRRASWPDRAPLARGAAIELAALLSALPRLPRALWRREIGRRHYVRSDREVLRLTSGSWDQ